MIGALLPLRALATECNIVPKMCSGPQVCRDFTMNSVEEQMTQTGIACQDGRQETMCMLQIQVPSRALVDMFGEGGRHEASATTKAVEDR